MWRKEEGVEGRGGKGGRMEGERREGEWRRKEEGVEGRGRKRRGGNGGWKGRGQREGGKGVQEKGGDGGEQTGEGMGGNGGGREGLGEEGKGERRKGWRKEKGWREVSINIMIYYRLATDAVTVEGILTSLEVRYFRTRVILLTIRSSNSWL